MALSSKLQAIVDAGTKHEQSKLDAAEAATKLSSATSDDAAARQAVIDADAEFDAAVLAFKQ